MISTVVIKYLWRLNMSDPKINPLAKHFRQPILYIKLPSNGRWWPEGALNLSVTGEIPIYAMTARDEITLKTPDALMNGSSTVQVIESCCPSIQDAWKLPNVDLDPLLIAIRIASYGPEMEFTAVCPHCQTVNEQGIDLSVMLDRVTPVNWDDPVTTTGMTIQLKPQNYEEYNKNNLLNFEEQKLIQLVNNEDLPEDEKTQKFNEMFQKLIETGINQISKSIDYVLLDDGTKVSDPEYIKEFLNNCDRKIWDLIKTKLESFRDQNKFNEVTLTCSNAECSKSFITPFVFEQANFFE